MDIKLELRDASPDDVKRLIGLVTPASQPYSQQPQAQVQVQDVSSSIAEQAMLKQLGILSASVESLMQAQQNQLPSRTVVYAQPQLSAGPDFPILPPSPIPTDAPRYQTQPLPTIVQEPIVEVEGYKVPAWFDKWASASVAVTIGVAIAVFGFPWFRSLQQPTTTQKLTPPATVNQKSGNVLAVPGSAGNPPTSKSNAPPPPDVLILPAVK